MHLPRMHRARDGRYAPTIFFGICALVSTALALNECLAEAKFEKAAKADLAALAKSGKSGAEML